MRPNMIIIHHSLTADGATVSWGAIRNWHMGKSGQADPNLPNYNPYKLKPMRDIGYHMGIELIQNHYEVLVGRPFNQDGAHTVGQNSHAIGICFVGDFDKTTPPQLQWQRGVEVVASICDLLRLPVSSIRGHREFASKSCPGKLFNLEAFRSDVERAMGGK